METTNRKYRNIIGYLAGFPWAIGYMVLPWVAYTFLNWRSLAWCVAIPSAMFTCLYLLFLPESPRWSIVNGKFDQARKTLNFIARVNRRKIPNIDFDTIYVAHTGNHGLEKSLTSLRQASGVEVFWKKVKEVFTTGFLLVKTPIMRKRTILLTTIWVSSSMTYYILSFVSVRRHGNIFWNFFLLGATEIPSYICVMLAYQYCGRKLPCIVCALLSSLCSFTVAALQQGKIEVLYPSIVVIASTAAKFFINPPYHVVWMWGSEIFPTVVRTFSLTFACSITMIFNSSVPHIMDWGDAVWPPLPMVLTGLIGILSAICSAWLPETKGMHMPETIHDIEDVKTLPRDKVTQLELLSKEAIESK